jgi:hypothetical protein
MAEPNSPNTSTAPDSPKSSSKRLLLGAAGAVIAALLLLVVWVLPAEYGIDPTGAGRALGLTEMQGGRTIEVTDVLSGNEGIREVEIPDFGEPVPLPNTAIHQDQGAPAKSQTFEITIPAEQETEIKTVLGKSKVIMYSWQVDRGTIYADFHGHDPAAGNEFWVRYKEHQEGSGSNGSLVAPFDGEHGWYWLNYNDFPVTVTLTVTGFYDDVIDYGIL